MPWTTFRREHPEAEVVEADLGPVATVVWLPCSDVLVVNQRSSAEDRDAGMVRTFVSPRSPGLTD